MAIQDAYFSLSPRTFRFIRGQCSISTNSTPLSQLLDCKFEACRDETTCIADPDGRSLANVLVGGKDQGAEDIYCASDPWGKRRSEPSAEVLGNADCEGKDKRQNSRRAKSLPRSNLYEMISVVRSKSNEEM